MIRNAKRSRTWNNIESSNERLFRIIPNLARINEEARVKANVSLGSFQEKERGDGDVIILIIS